ncbi:protein FAR1-RELATED SEQUENCE 5-like [Humulus lupulus]|uniref:protein FAR1-RELATED SEQUENCE 5-like n=1 Tax=Humulus lupulus TaxID=3486 RepID=UPI002B4058C8|nr:protein FAR1-RELATED SEQUENCE 5-like [Humulus lupulus]
MDGIKPKTVTTDGDEAIKIALMEMMLEAVHKLCYWHLHNKTIVKVKDPAFASKMTDLVFKYYSVDEFEQKWADLKYEFDIEGTNYAKILHERRKSWAESYLGAKFFCGMTTTQRNEGVNAVLKKKLNRSLKLYEVVRAIDMSLSWIRQRQAFDDYETLHSSVELEKTNMPQIEEQLSNLYTRNMFYKVRHQMQKQGRYTVESTSDDDKGIILHLLKYPQSIVKRSVMVTTDREYFVCECQYILSFGTPCRHIFEAMKHVKVIEMPESLILKQWTLNAREPNHIGPNETYRHCENKNTKDQARFGSITSKMAEIPYIGSRSHEAYEETMRQLGKMHITLQMYVNHEVDEGDYDDNVKWQHHDQVVLEPIVTRSKGTAKMKGSKNAMKRKCSICKKTGHNKATCIRKGHQKINYDSDDEDDEHFEDAMPQCGGTTHTDEEMTPQ